MKGHIRERGKGNWYAVLSVRDPETGKRKVKWLSLPGCKGKRQAELECGRIIQEIRGGSYIDGSKITVAEFLDKWDRDYAAAHVSPKTRERYGQLIKNQIKPNLGKVQLQKLRPIHLTDLYTKLLGSGLSTRTVNHVHRLLHVALGHAGTWELVKQNVASSVDAPTVTASEIVILTPDQVRTVLKGVEGRTLQPILMLALATGARRQELLALRIGDFDPGYRTLRVRARRRANQSRPADQAPQNKTWAPDNLLARHSRKRIACPYSPAATATAVLGHGASYE